MDAETLNRRAKELCNRGIAISMGQARRMVMCDPNHGSRADLDTKGRQQCGTSSNVGSCRADGPSQVGDSDAGFTVQP